MNAHTAMNATGVSGYSGTRNGRGRVRVAPPQDDERRRREEEEEPEDRRGVRDHRLEPAARQATEDDQRQGNEPLHDQPVRWRSAAGVPSAKPREQWEIPASA
jgi:hypothetical protein